MFPVIFFSFLLFFLCVCARAKIKTSVRNFDNGSPWLSLKRLEKSRMFQIKDRMDNVAISNCLGKYGKREIGRTMSIK